MNYFYKTMVFRILVFSCCFMLVGTLILLDGMKNIAIYYSSPICVEEMSSKRSTYVHVKLEDYRVLDVIHDSDGDAVFFIIEVDNNYLFVESHDGTHSYIELCELIGKGTGPHDYVINGYFVRSKHKCVDFLTSEIVQRGYSNDRMILATKYSVLLFKSDLSLDKVKVVFGVITILFCFFSFRYSLKKKRQYFTGSKFWFF